MKSRIVGDFARQRFSHASDRAEGHGRAAIKLAAHQITVSRSPVPNRLPVQLNQVQLQDTSSGAFAFIAGYSMVGGPDVVMG